MKPIDDTYLRWLGPVGLYAFVALFFRLDWYTILPLKTLMYNDSIALSAGLVCWQIARWVVLRIQHRYPGLANTRRRLLWLLAALPVLVFFAWLMRHTVRFLIDGQFLYFTTAVEFSRTIGIQVFYHFIYFTVYEGTYVLREWKRATVETSDLEKMSIQSQLASLQSQVNPHFLFNSLNSLSSLINEDPRLADQFLDELTSVFRYLLQAGEQRLVPLREEVAFIEAYFHLLRTRYQKGIQFDMAVDDSFNDWLIPPLTLQVLVENAVRYNIILADKPLRIRISTTSDGWLRVENTLQRKNLRVDRTGAGLTDLVAKYKLLGQDAVRIDEGDGWFVVSVPLLQEESVMVSPALF
ncbi:sensor histidine kinase [Spirosoma sp. KNUC1025]|uniref:sensor histidine kinase n=1 Tax=Spirosoma sp. KNUC1025 TaxID=2894082 RepID=UPI00386AB1A1|nr:histidine kinase [Spirosoma sp. KNUC1025]